MAAWALIHATARSTVGNTSEGTSDGSTRPATPEASFRVAIERWQVVASAHVTVDDMTQEGWWNPGDALRDG